MAKQSKGTISPIGQKLTQLERREVITKMILGLAAICFLLLVADLFHLRHEKFHFAELFGFYGVFGFLAFAFIIFSTKVLKQVISRKDDYYAPNVVDAEKYPSGELDIKGYGDE